MWTGAGQLPVTKKLASTPSVNTRHSPKVISILDQRRRRWANIEPTWGECRVFAGTARSFCLGPTLNTSGPTLIQLIMVA